MPGLIKPFIVFHQSLGELLFDLSFSTNLSRSVFLCPGFICNKVFVVFMALHGQLFYLSFQIYCASVSFSVLFLYYYLTILDQIVNIQVLINFNFRRVKSEMSTWSNIN